MAEESAKKKLPENVEEGVDPDLDSLLDDALSDFTQLSQASTVVRDRLSQVSTVTKEPGVSNRLSQASTVIRESGSATAKRDSEAIRNELILKAVSLQFENEAHTSESDESSDGVPDNFHVDFKKMAEVAVKALEEEAEKDEFSAAIAQTLKNLSENTENLQNQFGDPDEIANMFENLGLNAADAVGQPPQVFPFFQQIMQTFLSKEVLYPSMKELLDKYPAWLEENKAKLSKEDYTRYQKQQKIMMKVCSEFELESETDSEEVTERRFKKIMELMEKMQTYGHPPKELMGNMTMSVDEHGMPHLPAGIESPDQCCVG